MGMEYLDEDGLARYDGLLKNWVTFKSGTVDGIAPLLNWQRTATAGVVTFYPLPAAPIDPTVNFAFTETGPAEGTKGPDNPSTITGVSTITVTRCETVGVDETQYTVDLGGTYHGGSVDLSAGTMTVTWAGDVVTGTEGYVQGVTSDAIFSYESNARIITNRPFSNCICERFTNGTDLNCFRAFNSGRIRFYVDAVAYPSVESFSSWLASLYASGTPLIMVYQVATPYTVQLTPTQIYSLSQLDPYTPRLNTVYSDQISVHVGYPKSPQATSTELTNAIISLGGNV